MFYLCRCKPDAGERTEAWVPERSHQTGLGAKFENVVTLPCIWFSHPFLTAICTRLCIQPHHYTRVSQGTQQRADCDCLRNRVQVEKTWVVEWRQRPYQSHLKTGTGIKGALRHTHTFQSPEGAEEVWEHDVRSWAHLCWWGGALHALVASSLSHEAFPFSEDHMESNRWKKRIAVPGLTRKGDRDHLTPKEFHT